MEIITTILSAVLAVITVLGGGYLAKIKAVVKEAKDIPDSVEKALADNKITAEELKVVLAQVKEFLNALKALMKFK